MGYKFLRFTGMYDEYKKIFLKANPDYQGLSFQELYDRFNQTHYGYTSDFLSYIEKNGNDVFDFYSDFKPLQTAWAREHGVKYNEKNWLKDIIFKQVKYIQPDVIFLADLVTYNRSVRNQLRKICDNKVKIVAFHSNDIVDFHEFNDIDLFCTAIPSYIERLKEAGGNPFLLSHAFDHKLINHVDTNQMRDLDFSFAGSLGNGINCFSSRYYTIGQLLSYTPLQVWGRVAKTTPQSKLAILKILYKVDRLLNKVGISNRCLSRVPILHYTAYSTTDPSSPSLNRTHKDPSSPPLDVIYKDRFHESVFGLDYFSLLARSKIVLNIQGEYHLGTEAVNLRLYEATGMGACLVTDWRNNIPDIFEPDKEIVTFKTIDECVEKVRYLLENEREREAIARAGQARTLKDHTWEKSTKLFNDKIEELLG